jgi:hypothetical protein
LVAITNNPFGCYDFDLSGPNLASLVLIAIRNPLGCDPHVDPHLPFPPSWLQLLATLMVAIATPRLEECEDDTHTLEMGTWESFGTPKTS